MSNTLTPEEFAKILREVETERERAHHKDLWSRAPKIECVTCKETMIEGSVFVRMSTLEIITHSAAENIPMDMIIIGKRYPQSSEVEVIQTEKCICSNCLQETNNE